MNVILIAVISLGVIALVLAAILYVASKKFAVYEDPRIAQVAAVLPQACLLYTSPSPRDMRRSRMPSSA